MSTGGIRGERWLAIGALVATVIAMAAVVLMSVNYQRAIGNSGFGDWSLRGVFVVGVLFGLPLVLEIGACVSRGKVAMVLRWACVVVLALVVLLFAFGGGIFFLPAVALMLASAALSTGTSTPDAGSEPSQSHA